MLHACFLSNATCFLYIFLCLEYFDLSLQYFYISLIKIVLASCHLKNNFVITYLLEDEQELSLGMLMRCERIYNFDALCMFSIQCLIVYACFLCIFLRFPVDFIH